MHYSLPIRLCPSLLVLLVGFFTIPSNAIDLNPDLPSPSNLSNDSTANSRVASNIFLHFSTKTSSKDIASQFDIYYEGGYMTTAVNNTNNTLNKRESHIITCGGVYPFQARQGVSEEDLRYPPFGAEVPTHATQAGTTAPGAGPELRLAYETKSSWCNNDRDLQAWTCQRRLRGVPRGPDQDRYEVGACLKGQICVNGTTQTTEESMFGPKVSGPYAACLDAEDVEKIVVSGTVTRVIPKQPFGKDKGVQAIFSTISADGSAEASAGGALEADSLTIRAYREDFGPWGERYFVPLHKSATCNRCSSLRLDNFPAETASLDVSAQFPDMLGRGRMDFVALS